MSVEELVKALEGLQHDHENRESYNSWLQKFQKSPEAWSVTYDVLSRAGASPYELRVFCAQTLRHKISRDLYQIPTGERLALKDKIVELLESNADLVSVVGVQLCVALASFAMQVVEWSNALEEMITRLHDSRYVPVLFEFLKVLPEEFSSSRYTMIDPALKHQRAQELIQNNAYKVISFLVDRTTLLQNDDDKVLFFETLDPWLLEVPVGDIVDTPILDWIFGALGHEETIEAASDCLLTLLDEVKDVREPELQRAIEILYTKLIESRALASQYPENPELHRNMTRIYARAGENWHILLAERPEVFSPLLEAVSDCVMVPYADLDVIEYTFGFFQDLKLALETRNMGDPPVYRFETAIVGFRPVFRKLLQTFTRFLQYPASISGGSTGEFSPTDLFHGNREEEDKFKEFRYDIGDMLKVCIFIVGSDDVLTICADRLEELLSSSEATWQEIEALLFSVRTMSRDVPDDNLVLPRIFHLFPRLPKQEKVYHASLLILGTYSTWAAKHEEYIEFELRYIMQGVGSSFYEVRRAGAHAMMFFCTDCAPLLVRYVPELLTFYNELSGFLDLESFSKIGDGIGNIMNELDGTDLVAALAAVFDPVTARAQAIMNHAQASPQALDRIGEDIHALGSFVATVRTSGEPDDTSPLTLQLKRSSDAFVSLLDKYGIQNAKVTEGVSRFSIYSIHNCGRAITDQLVSLLKAAASVTKVAPRPVLFELGGSIAQCFNNEQDSVIDSQLLDIIWQFSEIQTGAFLEKFESADPIESLDHSFVESGFHYLCDFAVYYTPRFVFSSLFDRTVKAAARSLSFDDNGVLISVANYLEDLGSFHFSENGPTKDLDQTIHAQIARVTKLYGAEIVYQVFNGYLFNYDSDFEPKADALLEFVFRACSADALLWLQVAVESLPQGTVSEEEKMQTTQRVFDIMSSGTFHGIGATVRHFAKAYAQRALAPR